MADASASRPAKNKAAPGAPNSAANQGALNAAALAAGASGLPALDKIVVAIHGIGSQLRSSTIRSVAQRFGARSDPPLPVMPLGFFNIGKTGEVRVSRLDTNDKDLARIGFAEVFWADIPEQVVTANDTLEETKAWGRTVVSRAEATYNTLVPEGNGRPKKQLTKQDFELGVGVVEEIVETIDVLENLLKVTAKAGLFKFELAPLLRDFVGDVQLVTDFPFYREKIIFRFHSAMTQIVKAFTELHPGKTPEIYIVAHSEGTVVSLIGLLEALSGRVVTDPDADTAPAQASTVASVLIDTPWIEHVRGYMTIGSPIDKHIALWPKLWEGLHLKSHRDASNGVVFPAADAPDANASSRLTLKRPIQWRNYYDFGDPIGFRLDSARALLLKEDCKAFDFEAEKHDFGFSRYWLPGKAHNDYWNDPEVFGHFIDDVVSPTVGVTAKPPPSHWWVDKVSTLIPYLIAFVLHLAAVYVLYRAVVPVGPPVSKWDPVLNVGLLGWLLLTITAAARLPRLVKTKGPRWYLAGLAAFLVGALPIAWALPTGAVDFLAGPLSGPLAWLTAGLSLPQAQGDKLPLLAVAFAVASSGWWLPRRPGWGRRSLLGAGMLVIAFIIGMHLYDGSSSAPVWPVLLAGLAFLYLWWLGILLFDLTFIWHRYIRRSVAVDTLAHWLENRDAVPRTLLGLGSALVSPPR